MPAIRTKLKRTVNGLACDASMLRCQIANDARSSDANHSEVLLTLQIEKPKEGEGGVVIGGFMLKTSAKLTPLARLGDAGPPLLSSTGTFATPLGVS